MADTESAVQRNLAAIKFLRDRPGKVIHYGDITEGMGLPREEPHMGRINAGLSRTAREHPERGIRREGSGYYVYRPELDGAPNTRGRSTGPAPGDLYEVVGKVGNVIIVRDAVTTELYRLEKWRI